MKFIRASIAGFGIRVILSDIPHFLNCPHYGRTLVILKRTKREHTEEYALGDKRVTSHLGASPRPWAPFADEDAKREALALRRAHLMDGLSRCRRAEMWRPKTCQWIDGDHRNPACGHPVRAGKPFCEEHAQRAYRSTLHTDGQTGGGGQ